MKREIYMHRNKPSEEEGCESYCKAAEIYEADGNYDEAFKWYNKASNSVNIRTHRKILYFYCKYLAVGTENREEVIKTLKEYWTQGCIFAKWILIGFAPDVLKLSTFILSHIGGIKYIKNVNRKHHFEIIHKYKGLEDSIYTWSKIYNIDEYYPLKKLESCGISITDIRQSKTYHDDDAAHVDATARFEEESGFKTVTTDDYKMTVTLDNPNIEILDGFAETLLNREYNHHDVENQFIEKYRDNNNEVSNHVLLDKEAVSKLNEIINMIEGYDKFYRPYHAIKFDFSEFFAKLFSMIWKCKPVKMNDEVGYLIWLSFDTADRYLLSRFVQMNHNNELFIELSFELSHINTDCSNIIFRTDYNSGIETNIIYLSKSDKEANEKWNELIDLYGLT